MNRVLLVNRVFLVNRVVVGDIVLFVDAPRTVHGYYVICFSQEYKKNYRELKQGQGELQRQTKVS